MREARYMYGLVSNFGVTPESIIGEGNAEHLPVSKDTDCFLHSGSSGT